MNINYIDMTKDEIYKAAKEYSDSLDEFARFHTYPREAFRAGAQWANDEITKHTLVILERKMFGRFDSDIAAKLFDLVKQALGDEEYMKYLEAKKIVEKYEKPM